MSAVEKKTDKTELRGLCPVDLANALDAIALSEGMTRNDYIVKVLGEDVKRVLHKSSLIQRTLRGNPLLEETERK